MKSAWTQVTPSEYPWEREALAFLKERLPDFEPYRAWANFEFVTDGTVSEVDVLVIARKAIFLVEIKSWPGRITGDAGTWMWTKPGSPPRPRDNPYLLANRKAKRLKSLLGRQKAMRGKRMPFIAPLVFLSDPEVQVSLDPGARHGIVGRDSCETQGGGLPGVVETITKASQEELERLRDGRIDRPMAKALTAALEQAGIRPAQHQRQVGDLELRDLLDDGAGYQDRIGVHPRFPDVQHRVRIYGSDDLAGEEQRAQLGRAARREYELLHAVSHPGIVRALAFHEHELGPAIVFERSPNEERLDHFLARRGSELSLYDRLDLVRDLAEAVAHAHSRRLYHRALSPRSVLITNEPDVAGRLRIINWQTGALATTTTAANTLGGTVHPEALVDDDTTPYLAPETITQPDADPELLDVFSLGAIAYHVFSGQPPAANLAALIARLQRDGALEISAVLDGAGAGLEWLIREATFGDASHRLQSVADVLAGIDAVLEESTAPSEDDEVDPADAVKGDRLGPLTFEKRLGRGSTALALLVRDEEGQRRVLKVANDPERNERVRDEGEVLAKLRHPSIVAMHGSPVELSGRTGIVLAYASGGTLAQMLRRDGRVSLENLQVWGDDLLSALAHLEQEGIPHRDIKPENLGIAPVGTQKKPHLVLLDFSLARASIDQLGAGTAPYLDPFLGTGTRRQWDPAADRFSAAIVIHEMAAGVLPFWKAPSVDPRMVDDEVTIDADLLPRAVAGPLAELLRRALRRDASERFDTAEELLRAWRALFARVDAREETADPDVDRDALLAAATPDTPVSALGFGTRAADALDRLQVLSVKDLLGLDPAKINNLRGASLVTRGELKEVRAELQRRLGAAAATPGSDETALEDVQALDQLVPQLLPRRTARTSAKIEGLSKLLGLEVLPSPPAGIWPTQTEVASALHVTRARVQQINTEGRERWKRLPSVTRLRTEVVAAVEALGSVASVEEVERVIAAERGAAESADITTLARAAVRAAVETELSREEPRLGQRRTGSRVLLAAGGDERERQRLLDGAVRLGSLADELALNDTLLPSSEVVERLRARMTLDQLRGLAPERLVGLAAAASQAAAASALLELHPRGMDALRALRLGAGALRGATALTVSDVQRRIASRFPAAAPLPDRPLLDGLLRDAGIDITWDGERYVAPQRSEVSGLTSFVSSAATRLPTAHTRVPARHTDPAVSVAQEVEQRLERATRDGGLLVLLVPPSDAVQAGRDLERLPITAVDVDRLLLGALRAQADARGVKWHAVLGADASAPGERLWGRLQTLVAGAIADVEEQIAATKGTVLLLNPGLLVRYGQIGLIERLRDRILAGGPLVGLWVLVPADRQSDRPLLDGTPIPILTPNEVLRLPGPWLRNVHRARPEAA